MKNRLLLASTTLAIFFISIAPAIAAQDDANNNNVHSVTGCLSKAAKADEYNLKADDGSIWVLSTKITSLSEHLGHTVTATGKLLQPDAPSTKEKAKGSAGAAAKNRLRLDVTDVSMVSETCKK